MKGAKRASAVVVLALVAAACSGGTDPDPTLASGTTAPPTTTTIPSTTAEPTTTTATTQAPSTTQGADARMAEIEAAAHEAFVTWLQALYLEDQDLLYSVAGSEAVYEAGIDVIDTGAVTFVLEPTSSNTTVTVEHIVLDRDDCVAAQVARTTDSVDGVIDATVQVWFPQDDGRFKIARSWGAGTSVETLEPDCDLIIRDFQP